MKARTRLAFTPRARRHVAGVASCVALTAALAFSGSTANAQAAPNGSSAQAAPPPPAIGATPSAAGTQPPPSSAAATPATPVTNASLEALAWLHGCWAGTVNQREFREMWLAPAGGMMIGVGQTVLAGKTTDYEQMRIEQAADGSITYVLAAPKQSELAYRMTSAGPEDFAFTNPELEFPRRIVYHRGEEGWLYASAEGKVAGADKNVVYPMRHVDCDSGVIIPR